MFVFGPYLRPDREGDGVWLAICAFCLITSAGVRIAQETSSAVLEAREWRRGIGSDMEFDFERGSRKYFKPS